MHESRHVHAVSRTRGYKGQFCGADSHELNRKNKTSRYNCSKVILANSHKSRQLNGFQNNHLCKEEICQDGGHSLHSESSSFGYKENHVKQKSDRGKQAFG